MPQINVSLFNTVYIFVLKNKTNILNEKPFFAVMVSLSFACEILALCN